MVINQLLFPEGVTVTKNGNDITVKGPNGELTRTFVPNIAISIEGNEVVLTRENDEKTNRSLHGTMRSNLDNMVIGVSKGFEKQLELIGVGYRAQLQGKNLS